MMMHLRRTQPPQRRSRQEQDLPKTQVYGGKAGQASGCCDTLSTRAFPLIGSKIEYLFLYGLEVAQAIEEDLGAEALQLQVPDLLAHSCLQLMEGATLQQSVHYFFANRRP